MWYEISSGRFTFVDGKQSIIVKILWVMRQEENNIRWRSYGRASCAPPSRCCITPPSRPPARASSRLWLRPWPSGCAWPRAVLKYTERECSDACNPTWLPSQKKTTPFLWPHVRMQRFFFAKPKKSGPHFFDRMQRSWLPSKKKQAPFVWPCVRLKKNLFYIAVSSLINYF
jgi:hypothetical protein